MCRIPQIIMAQVGDILAPGAGQSIIIRKGLAARILHTVIPVQARIVERGHNLSRIVSASVPDDPQFPVLERLPLHRLNRVAQHTAPVVGRRDDSDFWIVVTSQGAPQTFTEFPRYPAADTASGCPINLAL